MNKIKLISIITPLFLCQLSIANNGKISKQLAKELQSNATVEVYLLLKNESQLKLQSGQDRISRLRSVTTQLKANAIISQNNIKPLLSKLTNDYKFYWINNSLMAKLDASKARQLIALDIVKEAYSNTAQKLDIVDIKPDNKTVLAIEWSLNQINAPQVWAQGFKGQNVLIAGADTGYQWDHEALKAKYAGWDGSTVDHNYRWHDSISNPNVDCLDNQNNSASCDDNGHGTHTMGTMVGDDEKGNQIGVAPDARWIGCRNMDQGNGTPATYTECFQFFLEPTDINDSNPDITKAPHIINNSWGCPPSEGCNQVGVLESVVNNVVDAGILVVSAAGNSGPGCNSIDTPIAIYNKSLTIGSTTSTDSISNFSSQGAVVVDGSSRIKPDISAPGSSIRSARLNGGFILNSGTSMAAPHVAGLAALMISANPTMAGKPKILKQVLLRSSEAKTSQQTCSGVLGSSRPNNTFGWGRIDALEAVNDIKDVIYLDNYENF